MTIGNDRTGYIYSVRTDLNNHIAVTANLLSSVRTIPLTMDFLKAKTRHVSASATSMQLRELSLLGTYHLAPQSWGTEPNAL